MELSDSMNCCQLSMIKHFYVVKCELINFDIIDFAQFFIFYKVQKIYSNYPPTIN